MKFHTAIVSVSLAASAPAQVENSASASIWWSPAVTITVIIAGVAIWAVNKFEPQIRNRLENTTRVKFPGGEIQFNAQVAGKIPEGTNLDQTREKAENGNPKAQLLLGMMYASGRDVPKNAEESVKWYRLAAEQELAEAQNNLGAAYHKGEGVQQDFKEAVAWYRRAAEQGLAAAQYNLGMMHLEGKGVDRDDSAAMMWFRLVADKGIRLAQATLGNAHIFGRGVPRDYAEARKWYLLAAEQGHSESQFHLGWMYGSGEGVPQNWREAYIWSSLAVANGSPGGTKMRDESAEHLSRVDLLSAQEEAARRHNNCGGDSAGG